MESVKVARSAALAGADAKKKEKRDRLWAEDQRSFWQFALEMKGQESPTKKEGEKRGRGEQEYPRRGKQRIHRGLNHSNPEKAE